MFCQSTNEDGKETNGGYAHLPSCQVIILGMLFNFAALNQPFIWEDASKRFFLFTNTIPPNLTFFTPSLKNYQSM